MINQEKKQLLEELQMKTSVDDYYQTLLKIGDLKMDYNDYLVTRPPNYDLELERLATADYQLCAALLTMILRENHFSNGSFDQRYAKGQVQAIITKMINEL